MSIVNAIRRNGFLYSLAILFNRLVPAWLFRFRRFVVYELDTNRSPKSQPDPASLHNNTSMEVRWCNTEAEYQSVEELTYFRRSASTGNLAACYATIDGHLAGGFWVATECFDESELGIRIQLEPHQAWLFAAVVRKEFRRKGIHSQMLQFMISELQSRGLSELLVAVNPTNIGSNRVHAQHAIGSLGAVSVVRFLKLACCFSRDSLRSDHWCVPNSERSPIKIRCLSKKHLQPNPVFRHPLQLVLPGTENE